MIKRSFFALTKPRMTYQAVELTPPEPKKIPTPKQAMLLLKEPYDSFGQKKIRAIKKRRSG